MFFNEKIIFNKIIILLLKKNEYLEFKNIIFLPDNVSYALKLNELYEL
jgi:hypothetical protein